MDASQAGEGKLAFTLRVPIGVVGAISPFNFPLNLVAHKIAPALAAGCAVVLKPASQTPLSALLLAELEHEAGLPPGWLNVLVGPASEIGDVLVEDERVRAITFTGSSEVGWKLRERAPRKKVLLELGNATPVIVHGDADLDEAAAKLAAQRVLVRRPELHLGPADLRPARVYDDVRRALRAEGRGARRRRPGRRGDRRRPGDRRRRARADPRAGSRRPATRGAEILAGGGPEGGLIQPTVIANAAARHEGLPARRSSARSCVVNSYDIARRGDRARQRNALRAAGRDLHGRRASRAARRAASSSSAASSSTRRPPSAPTRCPTAASRTRATRARGPRTPCASSPRSASSSLDL